MATEQTNITEVVVQVTAEATRVVVQAMAIANTDNNQDDKIKMLQVIMYFSGQG